MLNKPIALFLFVLLAIPLASEVLSVEPNSFSTEPNTLQTLIDKANKGDPNAQYNLGVMYTYGRGVSEDWSEGAKWFSKAAEHGNADAQCNLGYIYLNGRGAPQDFNEAIGWFTKAAERGHVNSQLALAMMYSGIGDVPKDYNETFKWCKKAADQGCFIAQINLAELYYEGAGVAKDYVEAYKWLLIAGVREGYYEAKLKQNIAAQMTHEQIAEAEKRAKEFVVKQENPSGTNSSSMCLGGD
jgi:hypothetical protein